MPPRQGQSQFISPVSSLKAPCWEASSSLSSREGGWGSCEDWRDCGVRLEESFARARAISSRVGRVVSSEGERGCETGSRWVVRSNQMMEMEVLHAASSAKRLLVLYQYIMPTAMLHLAVVLFQLLDWVDGDVNNERCGGSERYRGALHLESIRGACRNMVMNVGSWVM